MAVREPRDLLTRLADAGEEAIQRLGETPGADRLLSVAQTMRERMDEMQRRVRGIDVLEQRIVELERRLDELGGTTGSKAPARRSASASKSSSSGSKASSSKSASKSSSTKSSSSKSSSSKSGSSAKPKSSSSSRSSSSKRSS